MDLFEVGDTVTIIPAMSGYDGGVVPDSQGAFTTTFIDWQHGGVIHESMHQGTGELFTAYTPLHRIHAVVLTKKAEVKSA